MISGLMRILGQWVEYSNEPEHRRVDGPVNRKPRTNASTIKHRENGPSTLSA